MKAILKDGTQITFSGAEVKEITVSIFNEIVIVMNDGNVYIATSLTKQ